MLSYFRSYKEGALYVSKKWQLVAKYDTQWDDGFDPFYATHPPAHCAILEGEAVMYLSALGEHALCLYKDQLVVIFTDVFRYGFKNT